MKNISVMIPKAGEGQMINGAIVGKTERSTAYQLDDGTIFFDRDEAKETERRRNLSSALHDALGFNIVKRPLTAGEVVDLILRHEKSIREVMSKKNLRQYRSLAA